MALYRISSIALGALLLMASAAMAQEDLSACQFDTPYHAGTPGLGEFSAEGLTCSGQLVEEWQWYDQASDSWAAISYRAKGKKYRPNWRPELLLTLYHRPADVRKPRKTGEFVISDNATGSEMLEVRYMARSFVVNDADRNGKLEYYLAFFSAEGDGFPLHIIVLTDGVMTDLIYLGGERLYNEVSETFETLPTQVREFAARYMRCIGARYNFYADLKH